MKEGEKHRPIVGESVPEYSAIPEEQRWWFDKYFWGHVRIRCLSDDKDKDDPFLSNRCYFVEDDFPLFKNSEDMARFNKEKHPNRIIPRSEWNKYAVVIRKDKFRRPSFAVDFRVVERADDGSVALEPGEKAISIADYLQDEDELNQAVKEKWTREEKVERRKRQFERRKHDYGWEEDWEDGKY